MMLSVMKNDSELDGKSATVEENEVNPRVSGDAVVGSSGEVSGELVATDEARVSSMELDSTVRESGGDGGGGARVPDSERSEEVGRSEDGGNKETEDRVYEIKSENGTDSRIETTDRSPEVKNESFDHLSGEFGTKAGEKTRTNLKEEKRGDSGKYAVSDYKSLLSEFDDYVASEKMGTGISRALSYGFEVGDLVWGKVKSHPWWPGHIFNEAFASPSVRRTRRIGYVLVAFFGDSSYGWFDPAELIPFEPHFAEKSQQTNSKNFVRAVEEAMDEASRRSALGLTCKCRNPFNFRSTSVEGYYAVDVPDYETQALYSADQIKNARESFAAVEALSFVKRLALAPQEGDSNSIKFVKNKAALSAFRRAVFEEFDETYAQAFGARSSRPLANTEEPHIKEPPRAPLSGPLVIAETLGDSKNSKKPVKVKDSLKQDKYLFKRRDEADDSRIMQFGQVEASSAASERLSTDGSSAGDYVLQRRAPPLQTPMKHEQSELAGKDFTSSSGVILGKESFDLKPSLDSEKGFAQESKERTGEQAAQFPGHCEGETVASLKQDEVVKHSGSNEGSHQSALESSQGSGSHASSPLEGKKYASGVIKKVKVPKRPSGEMGSENAPSELKKKKKKKKESGLEPNSEHPQKRKNLSSGEAGAEVGPTAKKSSQSGSAQREDSRVNLQKRDSNTVNIRSADLDVPLLLSDLQALALDPFFGSSDKSSSGTVRQFFLRFRALVYQKSLVFCPPTDAAEDAKDTKPSKAAKALNRADDPTKAGKKRLSSDRQEDIAAKKLKKTNQMKSMASEKKTIGQEPKTELKEQPSLTPTPTKPGKEQPSQVKPAKAQAVKKPAPPAKVVEPTMLVMKFPPGTSLPSAALLKARFGRFGLLDQSAIRVFWKSSTCRVVFLYKADAQTAFRYATGNNSLFGNVNVRYFLRDVVESPGAAAEVPEPQKGKVDEPVKETQSEWSGQTPPIHQPILPPPTIQLKSCLKKPGDDPSSSSGNGNRGTARVKFVLAGEEAAASRTAEPFPGSGRNNNFNNNGNYPDSSGPSSSSSSSSTVAMEFVSKNFQNVVPPPSLPSIPPVPPHYAKLPVNNNMDHRHQVEPRHYLQSPNSIDISQQMLSLLSRCNDVVANVTGLLGYVPYHPL